MWRNFGEKCDTILKLCSIHRKTYQSWINDAYIKWSTQRILHEQLYNTFCMTLLHKTFCIIQSINTLCITQSTWQILYDVFYRTYFVWHTLPNIFRMRHSAWHNFHNIFNTAFYVRHHVHDTFHIKNGWIQLRVILKRICYFMAEHQLEFL